MLFTTGQKTRVAVLPGTNSEATSGDGGHSQGASSDGDVLILAHHLRAKHGAQLENIKFGFVSTTDMIRWKALAEFANFQDENGIGIKYGGQRRYSIIF